MALLFYAAGVVLQSCFSILFESQMSNFLILPLGSGGYLKQSFNAHLTDCTSDHLADRQYLPPDLPEKRKFKTPNITTLAFLKQNSSEKHCQQFNYLLG